MTDLNPEVVQTVLKQAERKPRYSLYPWIFSTKQPTYNRHNNTWHETNVEKRFNESGHWEIISPLNFRSATQAHHLECDLKLSINDRN